MIKNDPKISKQLKIQNKSLCYTFFDVWKRFCIWKALPLTTKKTINIVFCIQIPALIITDQMIPISINSLLIAICFYYSVIISDDKRSHKIFICIYSVT